MEVVIENRIEIGLDQVPVEEGRIQFSYALMPNRGRGHCPRGSIHAAAAAKSTETVTDIGIVFPIAIGIVILNVIAIVANAVEYGFQKRQNWKVHFFHHPSFVYVIQ